MPQREKYVIAGELGGNLTSQGRDLLNELLTRLATEARVGNGKEMDIREITLNQGEIRGFERILTLLGIDIDNYR